VTYTVTTLFSDLNDCPYKSFERLRSRELENLIASRPHILASRERGNCSSRTTHGIERVCAQMQVRRRNACITRRTKGRDLGWMNKKIELNVCDSILNIISTIHHVNYIHCRSHAPAVSGAREAVVVGGVCLVVRLLRSGLILGDERLSQRLADFELHRGDMSEE
jgi:hypothetical protein